MNKKKALKGMISLIFLIGFLIGFNSYSLDYSEVELMAGKEFLTPIEIEQSFPKTIDGKNFLGVKKEFDVTYQTLIKEENGEKSNDSLVLNDEGFLAVVNKESIKSLPNKKVELTVKTGKNETVKFEVVSSLTNEEYEYYSNFYTLDYSEIENLARKGVNYKQKVLEILPKTVVGKNVFDETKIFDITYDLNGEILDTKINDVFFDLIDKNNITIDNDYVKFNCRTEVEESKEFNFKIKYEDISIKPIVINHPFKQEDYVLKANSLDGKYAFDVQFTFDEKDLYSLLKSNNSKLSLSLGTSKVVLLNGKYVNLEESSMFYLLYADNSLDSINDYKRAVIEAFDSLPYNLKEYAVFNGLKVYGNDFIDEIDELIAEMSHNYNETITALEYQQTIGGFFIPNEKSITINTNRNFKDRDFLIDDFDSYYYWEILNDYETKYYNNGKSKIYFYTKKQMINYFYKTQMNTFYHEFMHFLDYEVRPSNKQDSKDYWLSKEQMTKLRPFVDGVGYGYKENSDFEFLAYSAEAYFCHPEYLKEKAPEIYDAIEKIISQLNYDKIEEFNSIKSQLGSN